MNELSCGRQLVIPTGEDGYSKYKVEFCGKPAIEVIVKICEPKKEDICYATTNRQDAVKTLAQQCDVVVVVGSETSSNSNRLKELAERLGCPSYLIDGADDMKVDWFSDNAIVGVTAGASAPESLVKQVINQLREWGAESVEECHGREESIVFALPKDLRHTSG